ncbi:unnamed protein product [Rhizoctonia solani]|uniref:Uncharacterized protein n=1 Tax=Rhizoctonia solani TaxID=456999 RepID=A0A8H3CFN7_9AGAM|nr:unnamed protein product [Rhizoctonia solani]
MTDVGTSNLLVQVRHLELGEQVPNEQLLRSARHIIDQAGTNHSNNVWQTPSIKRPPIDGFSLPRFVYCRPAPNRRSLLQSVPLSPPSNISPLLDWGSSPTELEGLGLLGLEEFRSSIKSPIGGFPVAQQFLLKRRRSTGVRPQGLGSSLTKKPRFAAPLPTTSHLPAVSSNVQNAALSALQSKSSTRGSGSVRLRLGLTKRTNIGSKLKSNRPLDTPYDVSVKVKLTPRNQTGDAPAFSIAESPGSSNPADGTLALGFKIPNSAFNASGSGKLQVQLPIRTKSMGASRLLNTSKILPTKVTGPTGRVLAPDPPSSLTNRIIEAPVTPGSCDPASPDSCTDTSMLSNVVPGSPLSSPHNVTSSRLSPPPNFSILSAGLLPTTNRVGPQESDLSNSTSDILLSASLSLSLEEPDLSNSLVQRDTTTDPSSHLDTSYDLKPNQLIASVFYDSSQDSHESQPDRPIYSTNPLNDTSITNNNYESPPWDLSQQDDQGDARYHADQDHGSPVTLMATKPMEARMSGREDSPINNRSFSNVDSSDPKLHHSKPGSMSVLYDSSQDSPRPQSQQRSPSDDYDQHRHSPNGDVSIPRPSWSPNASPRFYSNRLLSGTRPSSSWGSLPERTGLSPDDLVPASRSLSLEDFEVQRPFGHQLRDETPAQRKLQTPLQPSAARHSNMPIGSTHGSIYNVSSSLECRTSVDKQSGMSKLASYSSTSASLVGSRSPILSFTPLPKSNIPDNSLESIESPDTTPRIDAGKSFRPNPIFKFPFLKATPELDDDISFESQILRPKLTSAPHGTQPPSQLARSPDEVPRPENNGLRGDSASGVPNSDGDEQQAVDETENISNQKIIQSDVPSPAPDHPNSLTPQPHPPSPLVSKIYKGYLHTVIPQPHFLPSLPCPPPSLTEGMLASLVPPSFQNWFDKDGKPAQDQAAAGINFLSDTWGRAAWIIPVRGRAPWDGCSGALVSLRPIKERKKKLIVWTPASLRSFWTQMAGFRETKRVGSLSMSFEAVPGKPSDLEAPKQTSELKASRSFEFIKLYHDARVSLKLRTILQVLEFAEEDKYGVDAEVPKEGELGTATMRRLLGASTRLALLDSTGHIALIS